MREFYFIVRLPKENRIIRIYLIMLIQKNPNENYTCLFGIILSRMCYIALRFGTGYVNKHRYISTRFSEDKRSNKHREICIAKRYNTNVCKYSNLYRTKILDGRTGENGN